MNYIYLATLSATDVTEVPGGREPPEDTAARGETVSEEERVQVLEHTSGTLLHQRLSFSRHRVSSQLYVCTWVLEWSCVDITVARNVTKKY